MAFDPRLPGPRCGALALVGTAPGPATYTAAGAKVYVGDPWYPAAKVTLSDIYLKEIAAPTP